MLNATNATTKLGCCQPGLVQLGDAELGMILKPLAEISAWALLRSSSAAGAQKVAIASSSNSKISVFTLSIPYERYEQDVPSLRPCQSIVFLFNCSLTIALTLSIM